MLRYDHADAPILPSASINCPPTAVLIDNTQEIAEPVAPSAKPRVNLTSDTTKATDSNNYKDTGRYFN